MPAPRARLWVLLLALAVLVVVAFVWRPISPPPPRGGAGGERSPAEVRRLAAALTALEQREQHAAETYWAKDLLAQQCGQVFEEFWDRLNASTNRWQVVEEFGIADLILPEFQETRRLAHDIEHRIPRPEGRRCSGPDWQALLRELRAAGWRLSQVEFRHNRFATGPAGEPARSRFYFSAHLTNSVHPARAALSGDLDVDWDPPAAASGPPNLKRVDASRLTLLTRPGEPPFELVRHETVAPAKGSHFIDPLIAHDLDGDGRPEIILAARNLVYRVRSWDQIEREPLCRHDPGLIFTGVLADFTGDGLSDYLCARFEGLLLFRGAARGVFEEAGEPVWSVTPHLKYAQVLTCGDIDGDGDLDVWLGQYKGPFERGQMPTPYFDANDGHPAYLLLNDGHGHFTEATVAAGLGAKRWRRSYSGSLVDLDADGDLDLVVVSDFAGIDLYANDGRGRFTDLTDRWLPERHGFGMAHLVTDLNADGRLELLMMGMNCPTPQRLDALGLSRPEHPEFAAMRARMAVGNRLYQAKLGGGFEPSPLNASVAETGWSWGCSAADFDNDGWPDVFIATGHESRQSVRDYEPEFWRHDIYVGTSRDDLIASAYFGSKSSRIRGHGASYGGYEKNRAYWNQGGREFLEVGHLLGVALEQDSRNLLSEDLDGDGRVDLVATTFEAWPEVKQTLRVYRNRLESGGHWIGVRLGGGPTRPSPVGAVVTLEAGGRRWVRPIVTGDSHRSQASHTVHFGLGPLTKVDELTVRWGSGAAARTTRIEHPSSDAYHSVTP